jgi:hypothetical protein
MAGIWRSVASAVLLIVSLVIMLDFAFKDATLQNLATDLNNWAVVVAAFALGIGAYSLILRHGRMIARKGPLWPYSIILLVTMLVFTVTGLVTGSITSPQYNWIYSSIVMPVSSTLYGMNAFFIASASYRAFKAKSWEALVLLVAAIFLMLKNAPIGAVISPILPQIGGEIWDFAGATGMRALLIGIGIGTLALGLRVMIGQEKTPLGGGE